MSSASLGLLALLHRANQVATERFAAATEGSRLTPRQVQVLAAIDANEGASQTRIVELTGVDRSTLTDIMRRLQKEKLVERRRSKRDARAYTLKLNENGRQALAIGIPALESVEGQLLSSLSPKARADLLVTLEKIATPRTE